MCESTEDVAAVLGRVQVAPVPLPELGYVPLLHYRATDRPGNSVVIEYVDGGALKLYDNLLGVITNAPEFDWHLTNLRNYINLSTVELPPVDLETLQLAPLGAGSGMLGLSGDNTPPSRFVRAVAHTQTARATSGGLDTVKEVIRILDNFQLAVGTAEGSGHSHGNTDLPASTQWTTAADTKSLAFYYHTAWNRRLRSVGLSAIDFGGEDVAWTPLDAGRAEDIEDVTPRNQTIQSRTASRVCLQLAGCHRAAIGDASWDWFRRTLRLPAVVRNRLWTAERRIEPSSDAPLVGAR